MTPSPEKKLSSRASTPPPRSATTALADAVHSYDPNGGLNAMLFVDPRSTERLRLRAEAG